MNISMREHIGVLYLITSYTKFLQYLIKIKVIIIGNVILEMRYYA